MFGIQLGAATPPTGQKAPQAAGIPDYWNRFTGGGAAPAAEEPNWDGDPGGLGALYNQIAQPTPGPELDPQMVEVAPPKLPDMARAGLMGASAGATGGAWNVQPVQQANTGDLGKRIYPPGGTALTGRRVY